MFAMAVMVLFIALPVVSAQQPPPNNCGWVLQQTPSGAIWVRTVQQRVLIVPPPANYGQASLACVQQQPTMVQNLPPVGGGCVVYGNAYGPAYPEYRGPAPVYYGGRRYTGGYGDGCYGGGGGMGIFPQPQISYQHPHRGFGLNFFGFPIGWYTTQ